MCACALPSRSAATLPTAACSKVLRLGNRWDLAFHQSLKRDAKGEVVEFDIDPRLIEQFGTEASKVIRGYMDQGHQFVLVAAPDARPYVRMVTERLFATLPVLSPRRDRPRRADQVARHHLVTAIGAGHGPAASSWPSAASAAA